MCLILRRKKRKKEQPLNQQTVAEIDGTTHQEAVPQKIERRWKRQRTFAKLYCKFNFLYTNDDKIKKTKKNYNNWAPSKIRLRLGAEVDENYNNSNYNKNTIFLIQSNSTGTCAVTTMKGGKTHRQARERERKALLHKKLCYAWSDRAIGPQC